MAATSIAAGPVSTHRARTAAPLDRSGLLLLAIAFLALELMVIRQYGWFRDEFYYLVCADHPAAGYVDQPQLSIWILAVWKQLFGESLVAIRVVPALIGALCVFLAGEFAHALGGDRWAQRLAATATLVTPIYLGTHHVYSMNTFDVLLWLLGMRAVLAATRDASRWPLVGVVLGLGLLNKISVLWLGTGLVAGLIVWPGRRVLLTRGPWIALAIAAVLTLPHLVWQVQNGWPTLEFIRNATGHKMKAVPWANFVIEQVFLMGPATAPLWLLGIGWSLASRQGRRAMPLAVALLVVGLMLMIGGKSRGSYLSPAYPPMLAAGSVALMTWLRKRGALVKAIPLAIVVLGTLPLVPFVLPVLPVERYLAYARAAGMQPGTSERKAVGPLPQHYADMHGWQELTDIVARGWQSLTPEERRHAAVFGQNYGEAGAVTVLGRKLGLPEAHSGHNNFWLWGPHPNVDGSVFIVIGGDEADNRQVLEELTPVDTLRAPLAMPYERGTVVWIGRKLKLPFRELWPRLKHYD